MKYTILMPLVICMLACGKNDDSKKNEDNRPYATWYANGERFSSNNVFQHSDLAASAFNGGDYYGDYYEGFYFFTVNMGAPSSDICTINHHGATYEARMDTSFKTHTLPDVNGHATFSVDSVRAYYYLPGDTARAKRDSITFWGVFSYP